MVGKVISNRAQTEPIAGLLAVAIVCLAVGVYAGFLTDIIPTMGDDRSIGAATTDRIWNAMSDDGIFDRQDALHERIDSSVIPQGKYVSVNVTYVGPDGRIESAGSATFNPQGERMRTPPARTDDEVSDTAERTDRPVSIRFERGDIRPGTLEVTIWS